MNHKHAKEYLVEYASQPNIKDWLRKLIEEVVRNNGNLSELQMNSIYDLLKADITTKNSVETPDLSSEIASDVKLRSLKHNKGVCALERDMIIKFSPDITILYGLNGSGKSSYFRILNEIVGGNIHKDIVGNIYSDVKDSIEVDLNYSYNSESKCYSCRGNIQSAPYPLAAVRVFDSSYLDGFLEIRPTDESVVLPYGLHLFAALTDKIDRLKERITQEISLFIFPDVDTTLLDNNLREAFRTKNVSKLQRAQVEASYEINSSITADMSRINNELKDIENANYGKEITRYTNIETLLVNLQKLINSVLLNYASNVAEIKDLLYSYEIFKTESDSIKEQTEILRTIGNTNSEEWRAFILQAEKYVETSNLSKKICPYCRQPILDEHVVELLNAYHLFLNNKSQQTLQRISNELDNKISEITHIIQSVNFSNNIRNLITDDDEALYVLDKISEIECSIKSQYCVILDMLRRKKIYAELSDIPSQSYMLDVLIAKYRNNKLKLTEQNDNKSRLIEELKRQLSPLIQQKHIADNRDSFKLWFQAQDTRNSLIRLSRFSTRSITDLSEKAYNELITSHLISEFNNQLEKLGLNRHSVELIPANKKKGKVNMVIKVNGHPIKGILSEGELKAIGLALFISECKLQQPSAPIILDDPVNSLDHQIAANLANVLMSLKNQVIIFTHNRLFLDSFECSKTHHICKNMNNGCNQNKGRHIYIYRVQDEGRNNKGVIITKELDSSMSYIRRAKSKLQKMPFNEQHTVAAYLRNAIELIIDEIVFNGQSPTKYSNKNTRINWEALCKLNPNKKIIIKLNHIHSRLSGGDLHNGIESTENPISKDEFLDMACELEKISAGTYSFS